MFSKFKTRPKKQNIKALKVNFVSPIDVDVDSPTLLHSGNVLTIDEINKKRSSKYSYLAF